MHFTGNYNTILLAPHISALISAVADRCGYGALSLPLCAALLEEGTDGANRRCFSRMRCSCIGSQVAFRVSR
jgi:hypothetical protein